MQIELIYAPFGPTRGWTWGNGTLTVREYDTDGRLTTIDSAGLTTYSYNADGTIQSRSDDAPPPDNMSASSLTLSVASGSNRIDSVLEEVTSTTRPYVYDAAGHTLSDGSRTFTYNDAGRMASATFAGATTNYWYNALGQRVKKSGPLGTSHFVYNEAGHLLGVYDAAGARIEELVWFGDIPVATIRTSPTGGVGFFYIHTDNLNTPVRLTRQEDNAIMWRWDHDPYGGGATNDDADANNAFVFFNLRFPGQYFDAETGLNYNYFRDYDPAVGRYVESDPIGLRGGINTFSYVGADPANYSDSLGWHKGDKWYGFNNRDFQRWFHLCWKQPGNPDAGKEEVAEAYADWVRRGSPKDGKCDNTPPPPPVPAATPACGEDCKETAATVVVAGGTAYIIYRCVRMIPSLFPPLWPTIGPNLAVP